MRQLPQAELVIELGRYLVGEAGVYVARIVDRKLSRGDVFLVTDGGLHHHLSASGNFGQVLRKNYPGRVVGNRDAAGRTEIGIGRRARCARRLTCWPIAWSWRWQSRVTWWWCTNQALMDSQPARTAS